MLELGPIVNAQKSDFQTLAAAWLDAGATAFSVWSDGRMLMCWPSGAMYAATTLKVPVEIDSEKLGELRVAGLSGASAENRLRADARFVSRLVRLERELKGMTASLIDTNDQLLAMYNLNEVTRNYLELDLVLEQLTRRSAQLVNVEAAFLLLDIPGQEVLISAHPEELLSRDELLTYFAQARISRHEILRSFDVGGRAVSHVRNLLLMPIEIRGEIQAGLGLLNKMFGDFLSPDVKLTRAIAEHTGARIEHVLLYQESLEQARLQTEMELAQAVQANLLPQRSPSVCGLDLAARAIPASQVGGDFYDFIQRDERPLTFTIGDVSGKGMPAALLMAMTRTVLRTQTSGEPAPSPASVIAQTNRELYADMTDVNMFATVFVGQYENENQRLIYANSGHSPVIFKPANGPARLLEADGTAIGVLPESLCEDQTLTFQPGDLLIVTTDGFTEASSQADEMFGYDRLLEIVNQLSRLSATEIVDHLYGQVRKFSVGMPQADDQTIIVLKCIPESGT